MGKKKTEGSEIEIEEGLASKKVLGSLLRQTSSDHFCFESTENKTISSSSLLLDSLVKIESGQVIRLTGDGAELGKSSQALVFADNYMKTMPKSKTIYFAAEARGALSSQLRKRSGLNFVFSEDEWDYGTIYVYKGNIFETIAKTIETLLKEMRRHGEHLCIIIDSLDGCMLKSDSEKDLFSGESQKVAGVPFMLKVLFRRCALPISVYSAMMIIITQYSAPIRLDQYSKEPIRQTPGAGGSSLNHQSDYVFSYLPRWAGDAILENPEEKPDPINNKVLGVYSTLEIKKSGTDVSNSGKIKIPIKKNVIGCAIWREKEIVDICLGWGLLTKKASWISWSDDIVAELEKAGIEVKSPLQGVNRVYDSLESNPQLRDYLYNKILTIIS